MKEEQVKYGAYILTNSISLYMLYVMFYNLVKEEKRYKMAFNNINILMQQYGYYYYIDTKSIGFLFLNELK